MLPVCTCVPVVNLRYSSGAMQLVFIKGGGSVIGLEVTKLAAHLRDPLLCLPRTVTQNTTPHPGFVVDSGHGMQVLRPMGRHFTDGAV